MKKKNLLLTLFVIAALAATSVIWYWVGEFVHVLGRMS